MGMVLLDSARDRIAHCIVLAVGYRIALPIDRAEATGFEDLGLEHDVRRNVDNDVLRGAVKFLELSGHTFGRAGAVGHGLKQQFGKLRLMPSLGLGNLSQERWSGEIAK